MKGLRTTQGTYIVTPSGQLLATAHTVDTADLADFLRAGLKKYELTPEKERLGKARRDVRTKSSFPGDGLVLKVDLRKFYEQKPAGRRAFGIVESNRDFAWFSARESKKFLPSSPKTGDQYDVPSNLVTRLARFHFTDTVRAFADPYPANCVKKAKLVATVLSVEHGKVKIRYEGRVHSQQDDTPTYGLSKDRGRLPRRAFRQFDVEIMGFATFDLNEKRFNEFELAALGIQQGGGTRGSTDPVTIGVALTLAGNTPRERVEPHHFDMY